MALSQLPTLDGTNDGGKNPDNEAGMLVSLGTCSMKGGIRYLPIYSEFIQITIASL